MIMNASHARRFVAAIAILAPGFVAGSPPASANTVSCKGEGANAQTRVEIFTGLLFDRAGRLRQPFPTRGGGQATIRISGDGRQAQRLRGEIEIVSGDPPAFNLRVPAKRGPRTISGKISPDAASFGLALEGPDVTFQGSCGPRRNRR